MRIPLARVCYRIDDMEEGLLSFLQKHSVLKPERVGSCPSTQVLLQGVLDEGSYEVVMARFEKEFGIALPEGFSESVREEYQSSLKPTVRHFREHPEKAPHGYDENLTIGRLEEVMRERKWSTQDIYVIPKRSWLF